MGKKRNKKKNRKPSQIENKNLGQAVNDITNVVTVTNNEVSSYNKQKEKHFGFTSTTWAVLLTIIGFTLLFVFLLLPHIMLLLLSYSNKDTTKIFDGINYVTLFLSLFGTAASIASIVVTFMDHRRYKDEKRHSEKLLSGIEAIKEENHKIKLELLEIKNKIKMSKEVKDRDRNEWLDEERSEENPHE